MTTTSPDAAELRQRFAQQLVRLCRHFGLLERQAVCCGDLSVPQCVTLQLLAEQPLGVSEIAQALGTELSSATRLVDGMVRRDWVARDRVTDDRRRVVVTLTEHGLSEARRVGGLTQRAVATVLARIPATKHALVLEALELLSRALDDTRGALSCCSPARDA